MAFSFFSHIVKKKKICRWQKAFLLHSKFKTTLKRKYIKTFPAECFLTVSSHTTFTNFHWRYFLTRWIIVKICLDLTQSEKQTAYSMFAVWLDSAIVWSPQGSFGFLTWYYFIQYLCLIYYWVIISKWRRPLWITNDRVYQFGSAVLVFCSLEFILLSHWWHCTQSSQQHLAIPLINRWW